MTEKDEVEDRVVFSVGLDRADYVRLKALAALQEHKIGPYVRLLIRQHIAQVEKAVASSSAQEGSTT
jgi:hypothetical protein